MNWLWYTIGGTFLVIGIIAVFLAIIILKRKNNINGSWSRENEREDEYYKKGLKTFCCTSQLTIEENAEKAEKVVTVEISQPKIELKQCQKSESFRKVITSNEEFSESLFGTIDRLLSTTEIEDRKSCMINDFSQNTVACTSASLYKEVEIRKANEHTLNKAYPPVSLNIIKREIDNKKTLSDF